MKKKLKILIDGRCFANESSSISVYLYNLLKNIQYEDITLRVVINNPSYIKILNRFENIIVLTSKVKNNIIWDNLVIPFFAIRTGSEVIFYPKSSSCWMRIPNIAILTTIHGMIYEVDKHNSNRLQRIYWKYVGKIACTVSRKIVAVSDNDKKDIIQLLNCNPNKINVIPIGFNDLFLNKCSGEECKMKKFGLIKKKYFVQLGSVTPKKNQMFTLDICKHILRDDEQFKLVLIGLENKDTEYCEKLRHYINKLSLSKKVIFTGGIDQNTDGNRLSILMQNAFIGFFPSTYEGFGLPPLEMIAAGIPVLISNRGALREVYGANNTLPIEVKDPWVAEVNNLISDRNYYNKMLEKQSIILEKYKWTNITKQYVSLFKELSQG